MPGSSAVELPEALDFLHRDRKFLLDFALFVYGEDAGEVQRGIQQHGSVSGRKHEAIAVWPQRNRGVIFQKFMPKRVHDWRQAHGRAGMAGIRLLYGVDRQGTNGVDT